MDDYIIKPFNLNVLRARIDAVMRRSEDILISPLISVHNLDIDPVRLTVKVDDVPVVVSHTDFLVLKMLADEPGRIVTRHQIIEVRRRKSIDVSDRSVDVQIAGLRRKIGTAGKFIETVRGVDIA